MSRDISVPAVWVAAARAPRLITDFVAGALNGHPDAVGCPECGSLNLSRSFVRWHERWRKILPARPYRCRDCRHRVWRNPTAVSSAPAVVEFRDPQPSQVVEIDLRVLDHTPEAVQSPGALLYLDASRIDWQVRGLLRSLEGRLQELDRLEPKERSPLSTSAR
jgi:hypothetical protein